MRAQPFGERDHLGGAGHLEVEHGRDRGSDRVDVRVLNVAAILAQMRGDPVGAGALADGHGVGGNGLAPAACLPHRGDVIDVDVEPLMRHVIGCPAKPTAVTFAPLSQETTK